jgi:hypothetical protein
LKSKVNLRLASATWVLSSNSLVLAHTVKYYNQEATCLHTAPSKSSYASSSLTTHVDQQLACVASEGHSSGMQSCLFSSCRLQLTPFIIPTSCIAQRGPRALAPASLACPVPLCQLCTSNYSRHRRAVPLRIWQDTSSCWQVRNNVANNNSRTKSVALHDTSSGWQVAATTAAAVALRHSEGCCASWR